MIAGPVFNLSSWQCFVQQRRRSQGIGGSWRDVIGDVCRLWAALPTGTSQSIGKPWAQTPEKFHTRCDAGVCQAHSAGPQSERRDRGSSRFGAAGCVSRSCEGSTEQPCIPPPHSQKVCSTLAPTGESSGPAGLLDARCRWVTFRSRARTRGKCIDLTRSI